MKKKTATALVMVITILAIVWFYKTPSIPMSGKIYGNGAYKAAPISSSVNGLCGEFAIVDTQTNEKITTINLCEDNIKSIEKVGDNLEIVSDRKNPFYIKNLVTGEVVDLVK